MRVGVVGCGLMGRRRALYARSSGDSIALVADLDGRRAEALAAEVGGRAVDDWSTAATSEEVEAVVVATFSAAAYHVAAAALDAGKHVFCEKPLGVDAGEARELVDAAHASGTVLETGFTLRHHPAIERAHELVTEGVLGTPLWLRAAYGHGGRAGYADEWRARRELSGGGELLDQGVHLVDLSRWFLGPVAQVAGVVGTFAWDVPVEDNAFAILRHGSGAVSALHASWTQWRNLFRIELHGTAGYVVVEGLGGSYGDERLEVAVRTDPGEPPVSEVSTYADSDAPWRREWAAFSRRVAAGDAGDGAGAGYHAALVVDAVYAASASGRFEAVCAP